MSVCFLQVRKVGDITTSICKHVIDEWVSVTDDEICRALLMLLEGEKTVAEGAGASSVAALMAGKLDKYVKDKKNICAVISGGNIDMNIISMVIERGLVDTGRRVRVSMDLPDKPGSLSSLMNRISELKANM
jgi:threonine dehydratase